MVEQIGSVTKHEAELRVGDDLFIYYADYGPRDSRNMPLICLPGYWRNSRDFEELAIHLAGDRRILTPDLRGRGRSSRSQHVEDYLFERLVEDVLLLMQQEQIPTAAFCGTALGAQIGLSLARTNPERVAGLILNDTGLEAASGSATSRMASFATAEPQTFDAILDKTREQYEAQFPLFGPDDWHRMAVRAYRQLDDGSWERDFDQLTNEAFPDIKATHPDWWPEYRAARSVPVAILRGENSAYFTEDMANRMVAAHSGAKLHTILGSGHAPTLWETQSLAAVEAFLVGIDER